MNEQKIRELAYAKWQEAGTPSGDGVNFWLEAEAELSVANPNTIRTAKTQKSEPERAAAKKSNR